MKNFDIIKWAKDESAVYGKNKHSEGSLCISAWIDDVLLPKLEEVFHTSSNTQSTKRKKVSKA